MPILADFVKIIGKIGWARIDAEWWCPFCIRPAHALCPPNVRKRPAAKATLSKTAREAMAANKLKGK
jgi:hypothetical protein